MKYRTESTEMVKENLKHPPRKIKKIIIDSICQKKKLVDHINDLKICLMLLDIEIPDDDSQVIPTMFKAYGDAIFTDRVYSNYEFPKLK